MKKLTILMAGLLVCGSLWAIRQPMSVVSQETLTPIQKAALAAKVASYNTNIQSLVTKYMAAPQAEKTAIAMSMMQLQKLSTANCVQMMGSLYSTMCSSMFPLPVNMPTNTYSGGVVAPVKTGPAGLTGATTLSGPVL